MEDADRSAAALQPRATMTRRRAVLVACALSTALRVTPALAAEPNAGKAAAAEALFEQGATLAAQGEYEKACQRFEGSLELDAALGTMLRLADCYDRLGKTASAWSMFRDAASVAEERQETERLQVARVRAADAERRLPKLKLLLSDDVAAGLSIRLNGAALPRATWDVEIPVDPGSERIDAAAPGRLPWSTTVDVPRGPGTHEVAVPPLALAPQPRPRPPEASLAPVRDDRPGPFYTDVVGDTLLIAGVAATGVGTYFLVKGNEDMRGAANAGLYRDYDSLARQAERDQLVGALTVGGGGLLVATAVIRYLTRGAAQPRESAWLVGLHGVAYRGRF